MRPSGQPWPGGGWRRPWRACGRRASFLNIHVCTTRATSLIPPTAYPGLLHESLGHECLKSSLAFRKPATAVASRRPAWADGLMVGLDGHASLSAGRAPWRDGQAFLPLRRRPEGNVCRRRRLYDAVGTRMRAADHRIVDRRTQWHALSATINNPRLCIARAAPSSMLQVCAVENIGFTVDGEVFVGRRRSHRADVSRPRPQCPGRPPCPWLGPPWSLVP